jgi:D-alanine-D-alanine ligase
MSKIRVAIIFGGTSNEYETSLSSAANIIENIPKDKYEVICIGITKKGRWFYYPGDAEDIKNNKWDKNPDCTPALISPDPLHKGVLKLENGEISRKKIDVVFSVLYGKKGEDGTLTGILNMSGIPYVGSDLLSSAACMDKSYTRMILGYNGIKTSNWRMMFRNELNYIENKCNLFINELQYPLIVKPANFGLYKAINKVTDFDRLKEAVKIALANDDKIVVEEFIEGREIQVAIFGYEKPIVSDIGEVIVKKDDYDFNSIFSKIKFDVNASIDKNIENQMKEVALKAYKIMGCAGMARIDFYLTNENQIILSQVNTMPEFTQDSMYPMLMSKMGMNYTSLIDNLMEKAIENSESKYI